jgi:hypothetical protein
VKNFAGCAFRADADSTMIPSQGAPRRRLRDRLVEREGTANPALTERYALQNQLLLIDDDLREVALAMGSVEKFLTEALGLLEDESVTAGDLAQLAGDGETLDRLDSLAETLTTLRRRLIAIASQIK